MRGFFATGVAVLCGLVWSGAGLAATWVVDAPNPELECQNADSPSIELAVALAAPGDTIIVCPGEYTETVTVTKPLTLNGAGPDPHVRVGDPTQEAVLEPAEGFGFVIEAPGTALQGFTVTRAGIGARVEATASGFLIRKNLFRQNTTALELASDGAMPSVVQENTFHQNRRFAIFNNAGSGPIRSVEIKLNHFELDSSAIALLGQQADVVIDNNTLIAERLTGVQASGLRITITHNHFEDVPFPIRAGNLRPGLIAWNSVIGGRPVGIEVFSGVDVVVADNTVAQNGHGIRVQNFARGELRGNHVEANGLNGIDIVNGSRNNLVQLNKGFANGRDGIHLDSTSSVNRIANNLFDDNVEHDCHDDSVGPGTGGTRNIWEHNLGDTSNRPAICKATGQPFSEGALGLARPLELAFGPEMPCMPYAEARETAIESPRWEEAPWVCAPLPEDLEPLPEDA